MTFRERLKEEIDYKGYTLPVLAEKANISKRTLDSYVDSRGIIPPADTAVRLAQVLGVSVEYLVTGKDRTQGDFSKYLPLKSLMDNLLLLPAEIFNPIKIMIDAAAQAELEKKKSRVEIS